MKFSLLLLTLIVNTMIFSQSENFYKVISDYELETRIIQNHKDGLKGYDNIFTHIVFQMEDFSLLVDNFEFLETEMAIKFNSEEFYIDANDQCLIVTFEKSVSTTDDFLKIFKETMQQKNVFMYLYEESILVKK